MEGAVVRYAEGVAQALVGKLGQLLSEEYRLLSGVRGEVVHLRDEVAIMNALLRMLSEADGGAVDHFVREWMKQVRELAYDAEDCVDLFLHRVSCVPAGGRALGGAWHLFATLCARHRLAADIQAFRARALAISERRARYGVNGQALRPSLSFGPGAAASSTQVLGAANDPNQFVGIKGQVERLSDMVKSVKLMSDNQPDKKLKVVSIVGFGGLGKTTLAMEVCRRLEEEFDCQAIVSVSQAFDASKDMSGLLKRVLQQVVKVKRDQQVVTYVTQEEDPMRNIGDDDLATELSKRLADKRYLIVIDDVWTISAWDKIRSKLQENNRSSRIMVTTRIETVAKACSPPSAWGDYIYRVKPLEPEDSKKLFVNRVFGPDDVCPTEQETVSNILKKCGGMPLAVVSIASLLASYKSPGSVEMWERVCNSIGSQMESNPTLEGMRHVLTLSYNHLPHHLKACMMYLSIFPEDYVLRKDRLLNRWIAEGLVPEKRGLTSQEVAEDYFDELLSRNMIEPGEVMYDGTVTECRVHDMMLEVMVSKSLEANFASLVGGAQCGGTSYDTVRRLSIHGDDLGSGVEKMSMRHVRSLSTFRPKGQDKLLGRLAEFTLLRVLDLEGCKDVQDHHMKHVCRLFLLRFLNLNYTDIRVMPSQIGELQHLQTLWLVGTLLDGVPESVVNLEKLEHLDFRNRANSKLMRLPRGLRKMKALQGLGRLELRKNDAELAKEIGDLVQLRELHITLSCSNCSNGQVLKDLARSIGLLCSLRNFGVEDMAPDSNNLTFLHDLPSPPQLLRYLYIGGTIDKLPGWVESLTHLVEIGFWKINIHGDEIYGVLYKLPNLLKMRLGRKCCRDEELVARSTFKFQKLKELIIAPKDGTPKVFQFEEGAMAKLERLSVRFYNEQRSIPSVDNLTSLKEVQLCGREDNGAMHEAVQQLKTESESRQESDRFKVVVNYE